jgi:biotin carboxyl carrier protein
MASPSSPSGANAPAAASLHDLSAASKSTFRLTGRNRLLFFLTAWLIVLMPFLFWWSTWFGRPLSDKQIGEYLKDEKHPRHIQHALVQLGDRMARQDDAAKRWHPDVVRLASHSVEEVRNTDAWVMGQDPSSPAFHDTLLKMLQDPAIMVRGNAALSLVRFGDASGRSQIVALLQPARITAPSTGRVIDIDKVGTFVHQGGLIAKVQTGQNILEARTPIAGRIHSLSTAVGANVAEGAELVVVDPSEEQAWEALRALYLIGQPEDLPVIALYERDLPDISNRVRQQAALTEKSIRDRASRP